MDEAYIVIVNNILFSSPVSGKSIAPNALIAQSIPKQVPRGVDIEQVTETAESASSSMKILVVIRLLLQGFLKGSIEDLWTLFFTMQMMCYMVYYSISFPPNSELYIDEFRGIIEFDIFNPEKFIQSFFDEDFKMKEFLAG